MKHKSNHKLDYSFTKRCPYCGSPVVLRDSRYVYHSKKDYGKLWVCSNFPKCDAYVGCHPNTIIPLGRLANKSLRIAKSKAHHAFDPLWKSGLMTRKEAYIWLSAVLNIPQERCHIGMFNEEMCNKVHDLCLKQYNNQVRSYLRNSRYSVGFKRK